MSDELVITTFHVRYKDHTIVLTARLSNGLSAVNESGWIDITDVEEVRSACSALYDELWGFVARYNNAVSGGAV